MNSGDSVCFDDAGTSRISKGGCAIACTYPDIELACRIVDYCYSDEGILLQNYGIEGETFEFDEDGNPQLTDLVTKNPDMAFAMALIKFTSATPCSISDSSRNFLGYTQARMDALEVWKATGDIPMASGSVWNTDDQTEYTNLYADMASFCSTECLKFITGEQPMTEWDRFINDLTTMFDIDRMQELNQNAVDSYINKYLG